MGIGGRINPLAYILVMVSQLRRCRALRAPRHLFLDGGFGPINSRASSSWRSNRAVKCHGARLTTNLVGGSTTSTAISCGNSNSLPVSTATSMLHWEFTATSNKKSSQENNDLISNMLVCGDGDLSYSAGIANALDAMGVELTATVLEDRHAHNEVYKHSKSNADVISSSARGNVMFGIDATNLSAHFEGHAFDRIQFNFPHWKGKANNRYNRELLSGFFKSAAGFLSPRGEIYVALCDGQGGCTSTTLQGWRGSWKASMYAAEHGLLLARVFPYVAQYRLSSHRGVDRAFKLGKVPKMYVFVKPSDSSDSTDSDYAVVHAPREIQLCCRHELHIVIPDDEAGISAVCSLDQILAGDAIQTIIQNNCVPDGIRVEVPARQMLEIHESHGSSRIAVFLVVYCGEGWPMTRQMADECRERAEDEVMKYVPLRENRRGRTVSQPFPYPALHPEVKYHTRGHPKQQNEAPIPTAE